ncbi:PAS domain S-box protein, partial [bacterium]|nr:PAS domain S-box protein [bacterium]
MLKRFMPFFAAITLLLGLFFYQIRHGEIKIIKERLALSEMAHVKLQEKLLETFFIAHLADVAIISELQELKKVASGSTDYSSLENDFLSFSKTRGLYDQIRYLDKYGLEKIRVDLKDGKPFLVPSELLQNKSDRYYFKEIIQLQPGKLFLSPLDLNIEQHEIELPFKPMLRIGTPILNIDGEVQGALIINYLAASMLTAFKESSFDSHGENSLLNRKGFWLSSTKSENEWGFMMAERRMNTFAQSYPAAWKRIILERNGQLKNRAGLFSFSSFNPIALIRGVPSSYSYQNAGPKEDMRQISYPWKIVSLISHAQLQKIVDQKLKHKDRLWLGLFTLLFFLSGSLLWIFLKYRQKELEQQERITQINASLETRIEERTQQLNYSNKKLSTIIETTSQGFIMIDSKVRVIEINPAMLSMIGRSYPEVIGASWFDLISDEYRDSLHKEISLRKKGLIGEYDIEIPRPDGSTCSCHFSSTPLLNELNEVDGSFALVSDIGERLEFEQNLEKAKDEAEKNSAAKTL